MGYPGHRYRLPSSPEYRDIGMLPLMNTKSCSASSLRMLAARVGVVLVMSFHRRVISVGLMGNHANQFALLQYRVPLLTRLHLKHLGYVLD